MKQKLANKKRNKHQLLSEETTNKLKRGDLISGGISLLIFSILIMIGANISKNVVLLFISISISGSLGTKEQSIVIPLIN